MNNKTVFKFAMYAQDPTVSGWGASWLWDIPGEYHTMGEVTEALEAARIGSIGGRCAMRRGLVMGDGHNNRKEAMMTYTITVERKGEDVRRYTLEGLRLSIDELVTAVLRGKVRLPHTKHGGCRITLRCGTATRSVYLA